MKLFKRLPIVLLMAIVTSTYLTAETAKKEITSKTKPQTGTVSGRVFGITEEGDIKPARFAKIYLFQRYGPAVEPNDRDFDYSAVHEWLTERHKAMIANIEEKASEFERNHSIEPKSLSCQRDLLTYDKATIETLKWADEQHKAAYTVSGEADEDGRFTISTLPGDWCLLARGRAGLNDAVWLLDSVAVKAGQITTVKVVKPAKSCLVTESE